MEDFISACFKNIQSSKPKLLDDYISISSCAYEHGLINHSEINSDIVYFVRQWKDKFGINKLIINLPQRYA